MSGPTIMCSTGPFYMLPLGQAFEAISKAGYEAAEVMVTSEKESQDGATLRAMSEDFGLRVGAIHAPFLLLTRRVFSTDPLEKIKRSTELAQKVDSPLVVVHPPYRWQSTYARWCSEQLRTHNQSEQLTIAMENMFPVWIRGRGITFHRTTGIDDLRKFDDIVLDTSHLAVTGIDILRAFDELSERVRHIHLSNNLGAGRDNHALLTKGVLPIGAFLERLASSNYSGTITLELDIRPWAGQPAKLRSVLKEQREYILEKLGAPAGS
ncbi:MAG: sugar phosphate isomerase/epimerase family protein [Actinomycetota bacterium]